MNVDRAQDISRALGVFDFLKRHNFKEGVVERVALAFFEAANKVYVLVGATMYHFAHNYACDVKGREFSHSF